MLRAAVFVAILFALPVMAQAADRCDPDDTIANIMAQKGYSLRGPFSVDALEKENMIVIRETGEALPFGYSNKEWLAMKAMMRPGDQVFFLSHRDGRFYVEYHVLIRDGCIIDRLQGRIT